MAYAGSIIPVAISEGGLLTDQAPDLIPSKNLTRAENVQIRNGVLQKSPGSLRWNAVALPSGIVAALDYWPKPGIQYTVVVTRAGRVYRYRDPYDVVEITPTTESEFTDVSGTPPSTLTVTERVQILECGREFVGTGASFQPAKLMIFTGNDPVQVIYDEETTRHNLLKPALDWNGTTGKTSYPNFGIVHLNRVFLLGVGGLPHFGYASSDTYGGSPTFLYGHEDFSEATFNTALFNIYPGDGERLKMFFKYKSKLWALKYPRGLYSLDVPDIGTPAGWYFQKVNDDVGTATITGAAPILDDVWVINSTGAIQSLSATLNLGGVESANMLNAMMIENYVQEITSPLGFGDRQAFWHEAKKTAYFLYRGANSQLNSLLLEIDFTSQSIPKATIITKDQPNVLAIRRNVSQVEEVIYGAEDGYLYVLDQENRFVGTPSSNTNYVGTFQTPNLLLTDSTNPNFNAVAEADKLFDFVEVEFIPTGNTVLYCDVLVDGRKTETIQFLLSKSNQLDSFTLDQSRLQGQMTRRQRKSVHGRGRTISLRFYDAGGANNFKVVKVFVYARIGGVDEKGSLDAGTRNNT